MTLILFSVLLSFNLSSQIPRQGQTVISSSVYFEEAFCKSASSYKLELFEDSLLTAPTLSLEAAIPAFQSPALKWATKYWWKVVAYNSLHAQVCESSVHYFSLSKKVNSVNEDDVRFKVNTNISAENAGGLVILDYARGFFTREGVRVWTLPLIPGLISEKRQVRDMKLSHDSTITLIAGNIPIEIDFEGNLLWTAPYPFIFKNDSITYHHDFRKLRNGNYIVLAHKKVARRIINDVKKDSLRADFNLFVRNDTLYKRTFQSLVFEFDKNGKVVWYWDSNLYIKDEDLNYKIAESSLPSFGTHANALSVSRDNKKIYVGFRDLNRIVRIDRATKKVEFSYGEKYPSGDGKAGDGLIVGQHDATITDRGTILILNNNNDPKKGNEIGNLLELKDVSAPEKNEDLAVWSFKLNFDTLTDGKTSAAGNIVEMKNSNLLVCAGIMPRLFEVTKSKKIVWDAMVYGKTPGLDNWVLFPQYRIGYSPKLYFYHFLATAVEPAGKGKISPIKIYNTGNTSDVYEIKVVSNKNKTLYLKQSGNILPGESVTVEIPGTLPVSKNATVVVSSKHNKFASKTLDIFPFEKK